MDQEAIQCERSHVNPKWPSYKSVLGRIAKGPNVSDEYELNGDREYFGRVEFGKRHCWGEEN
nr:hypothetical protein [uncultured Pseudomonas sp.]